MLANCLDKELDKHPTYVNYAYQAQKLINKFTCDPLLFCLADPESNIKKVKDILEDVLRVNKYFKTNEIKPTTSNVVR